MATLNPSVPALRSRAEFLAAGLQPVTPQNDAECPICQDVLVEDAVQITACKHTFHTVCLLEWLQGDNNMHRTCPYCRLELYAAAPRPVNTPILGPDGSFPITSHQLQLRIAEFRAHREAHVRRLEQLTRELEEAKARRVVQIRELEALRSSIRESLQPQSAPQAQVANSETPVEVPPQSSASPGPKWLWVMGCTIDCVCSILVWIGVFLLNVLAMVLLVISIMSILVTINDAFKQNKIGFLVGEHSQRVFRIIMSFAGIGNDEMR
jgi:hypothetical protein